MLDSKLWKGVIRFALAGAFLIISFGLIRSEYRHILVARASQDAPKPARINMALFTGQPGRVLNRVAQPLMTAVIYGSPDLDVNRIDPATLRLAGAPVMQRAGGKLKAKVKDINGDGVADLAFVVWSDDLHVGNGSNSLALEGKTFDGRAIQAQESLDIVDLSIEAGIKTGTKQDSSAQNGTSHTEKTLPITPELGSTYTNSTTILMPSTNPAPTAASPYPSTITVAGLNAGNYKVSVTIIDFRHHFPDDVDMLLVSPTGARIVFWSDIGGGTSTCGATCDAGANPGTQGPTITINDAAAAALPDATALPSSATCPTGLTFAPSGCSFKPADDGTAGQDIFPAPAPAPCQVAGGCDVNGAPTNGAQTLNGAVGGAGVDPNGVWSLYVVDDTFGDSGRIQGGWSLVLAPQTAADSKISGTVTTPDGKPLEGVEMRLDGTTQARAITDNNGFYQFMGVNPGSFYSVTPARANYTFSPDERSFSQVGAQTDATFTATPTAQQTSNSIDSTYFFVRQHYLDFLGREPEAGGLAYWADQINRCGGDEACTRQRRLDVSAAFFKSAEFQETGSFIYRMYRGALGRLGDYAEFTADRQQVLGGDNLDTRKAAFAVAFVQRAEFVQAYQNATSAETFVDDLLSTVRRSAGVDLSGQRSALIAKYNTGSNQPESRSLVVRQVVDATDFQQAVYNHSFVTMEYFGYLRRNPEPDGLSFWYNVLNNKEVNNYRGMVCSFVTSSEYQQRFGALVTHSNAECGQ